MIGLIFLGVWLCIVLSILGTTIYMSTREDMPRGIGDSLKTLGKLRSRLNKNEPLESYLGAAIRQTRRGVQKLGAGAFRSRYTFDKELEDFVEAIAQFIELRRTSTDHLRVVPIGNKLATALVNYKIRVGHALDGSPVDVTPRADLSGLFDDTLATPDTTFPLTFEVVDRNTPVTDELTKAPKTAVPPQIEDLITQITTSATKLHDDQLTKLVAEADDITRYYFKRNESDDTTTNFVSHLGTVNDILSDYIANFTGLPAALAAEVDGDERLNAIRQGITDYIAFVATPSKRALRDDLSEMDDRLGRLAGLKDGARIIDDV